MRIKNKISIGLLTLVIAAGTVGSASALTYDGTKYGSYITTSGASLSLKDNKADGQFPSVNYKYNGGVNQDGVSNKSGYNTTVTKTAPSTITAIQPCVSRTALPSDCGNWIY